MRPRHLPQTLNTDSNGPGNSGSCKSGVDEEIKINSETLGHGTEECAMSFVIETDHSVSYKKDSDLE